MDKFRRVHSLNKIYSREFVKLRKPLIVYKKLQNSYYTKEYICKLELPAGTVVFTGEGRPGSKMRATQARVVSIFTYDQYRHETPKARKQVRHMHYHNEDYTFYKVGKLVVPSDLDDFFDSTDTCASGIHFYRTEFSAKRHC